MDRVCTLFCRGSWEEEKKTEEEEEDNEGHQELSSIHPTTFR